MSKDVVIAGVIVAACLGLVTVAFVVPRHKTSSTEIATTETGTSEFSPTAPNTNPDPDPFGPTDPFGPNNNTNVANNNNTNPFQPIDPPPNNNFQPENNPFPPINPPNNNFPPSNIPPVTPPVEPQLPQVGQNEEKTHVVASGETLGEISQKYYNTARNWKKIAEANKVDPNDIQVGQKLKIPVIESATPTGPTGTPVTLGNGERSYTIQKGDSYYRIAERELGNAARWKEVEKLNNIPAEDLRVGKIIKLPAKEATVPGIATTNTNTSTDGKVHVVATGETLSDISKIYYGTTRKWREIVKANPGIDPEGLRVGQKVKLPDIAPDAPSAPNNNPAGEQGNYTVKAGDTLGIIAERELGNSDDWKKIVEANPGLDPRKLRIGQKIIIPGKSGGTSTPPPADPGFGFGQPNNNSGFGQPNNNSGFGQPNNNSGFGQPSNENNSGFGNGSNDSSNPFAPGTLPSNNTTPGGFGSGSSDSTYPPPPSGNPPSGSPYPEPSSLPDTFGGSSGFNTPP